MQIFSSSPKNISSLTSTPSLGSNSQDVQPLDPLAVSPGDETSHLSEQQNIGVEEEVALPGRNPQESEKKITDTLNYLAASAKQTAAPFHRLGLKTLYLALPAFTLASLHSFYAVNMGRQGPKEQLVQIIDSLSLQVDGYLKSPNQAENNFVNYLNSMNETLGRLSGQLSQSNSKEFNLPFFACAFSLFFCIYTIKNLSEELKKQSTKIAELQNNIALFNERLSSKNDVNTQDIQGILELESNTELDASALNKLIILKEINVQLRLPSVKDLSPEIPILRIFGKFERSITGSDCCTVETAHDNENIHLGNNHDEEHSMQINSGEYLELVGNKNTNSWYAANRTAALDKTPSFEGSFGVSGWQRVGNMIFQWGNSRTDEDGFVDITFPKKFPGAFTGIYATHAGGGPAIPIEVLFTRTNENVKLRVTNHEHHTDKGWFMQWFATGY